MLLPTALLLACGSSHTEPSAQAGTEAKPASEQKTSAAKANANAMLLFLNQPLQSTQGPIVFEGLSIESIAPDPSDPDDAGGAAFEASVRLADSAQFEISAMADHKQPIESWSGNNQLIWYPLSNSTVAWARVELSSATAESKGPGWSISLVPGVEHPLEGSLHLRLASAAKPQTSFQVSYVHIHAIDAQTSTSSLVEEGSVTLDAQGAWTWRDYRFQVIKSTSAQVQIGIQRLVMRPAQAVAGNGTALPLAAQSSWQALTSTMKTGNLLGLKKLCSNEAYLQLSTPSAQDGTHDSTPSQAIVQRGMKWQRLAPNWTMASDTEIHFQLGSQAPYHSFVLGKQTRFWKLISWQLVAKP